MDNDFPGSSHKLMEFSNTLTESLISCIKNTKQRASFPEIIATVNHSSEEVKTLLDLSLRRALSFLVEDSKLMAQLMDLAFECSEKDYCEQPIPLILIEEWADSLPVWELSIIIEYLESRENLLWQDLSSMKGKGLVLLRLCNEILRRLSKSQNSAMSGRLLLFLSKVFPSGERSGVNLRGDINVDNTTLIGETRQEDDYSELYQSFWGLQFYIYHPVQALMSENWPKGLESTIKAFEKTKILQECKQDVEVMNYFPKYLSDYKLFGLQLIDPNWRIIFLIQIAIFLQHLLSYSSKEESKPPSAKNLNVSLINTEQETWIRDFNRKISEQLNILGENRSLVRQVQWILLCEKNWMTWKANSCPTFEIAPHSNFILPSQAQSLSKITYETLAISDHEIGSSELNRLWKNLKPNLIDYLSPLISQLESDLDEEDNLKYSCDEVFRWRLYRLFLSSQIVDPSDLNHCQTPVGIDEYCRQNFIHTSQQKIEQNNI